MPEEFQEWMGMIEEINNLNTDITTEQIDEAVKSYADIRRDIEAVEDQLKDLKALKNKAEQKIIAHCELTNKANWEVKGLGKAIVQNKSNYKLPKDPLLKERVFSWLEKEQGREGFLAFATINHMSFNKLIRETVEENPEFKLEGIEEPYTYKTIQWRKK